MWIYESHMGGLYSSENEYDYDFLYCDTCGDSDSVIGNFDDAYQFAASYANYIAWPDGEGGYPIEDTLEFLHETFGENCIAEDELKRIVIANKLLEEFEDE